MNWNMAGLSLRIDSYHLRTCSHEPKKAQQGTVCIEGGFNKHNQGVVHSGW